MELSTYSLRNSLIKTYHTALLLYNTKRGIPMPFKESVQRTFDSLNTAVVAAQTAISALDTESGTYATDVATIWNTKSSVTAYRTEKADAPRKMTPEEFGNLSFMFVDYGVIS